MNEIITVQNVRGYIDDNGTAFINAEDAARGLGFTQVKKDRVPTSGDKPYEAVRWERVNGYLAEYNYPPVKAGDFIPENIFYLLAMKANNEAAKTFQLKIANEILPTLRKTGTYSLKPIAQTPCANVVSDVVATAQLIQNNFAVKRGIALAHAIDLVSVNSNFNVDNLKQLLPPADHDTGYLNSTQIGEKLGLGSGRAAALKANSLLKDAAFQFKQGKDWRLTDEGSAFGEEMPYSKNGHSGYQIRWNQNIIAALNELH